MKFTKDFIPFRFGEGWMMEFDHGKDELESLQITQMKQNVGLETVNESREAEGLTIFDDPQFNTPKGSQQIQPDGSQLSPFNFRQQ